MEAPASNALAALVSYGDDPESPDSTLQQPPPKFGQPVAILDAPSQSVGGVAGGSGDGAQAGGAMRDRLPDGRVRSFPHVEGNYPGHAFISVGRAQGLVEAGIEAISSASNLLGEGRKLHTVLGDDRHISVSRTFALRRHQIESLVQDLKTQLKSIPSFEIQLSGSEVLTNDDKTRSFVVVRLTAGVEKMRSVIRAVDRTLARWQIEPYYAQQKFHVSVAWFAGSPSDEEGAALSEPRATSTVTWMVKSVQAKIGARSYNFKLRGS
mmetsp:Transcript_55581/g.130190  ORF Transcript_55581/g.130190 Transcript_55581/m.130190 type:complete len:266 (-) Transcript_55581:71-868(-)